MAMTCCEIMWMKYLLADVGVEHSTSIKLYRNSRSAIHICKNPILHERTKHIEMDGHFIRDKVKSGLIIPIHNSITLQVADLLTKALQPKSF